MTFDKITISYNPQCQQQAPFADEDSVIQVKAL